MTASTSELSTMLPPRDVEAAVLHWLISKNRSSRPPVVMAKLLAFIVALHQRGMPFDRRAVAEALSLNFYSQEHVLRSALDYGHLAQVYYVPSNELLAVVEAVCTMAGAA